MMLKTGLFGLFALSVVFSNQAKAQELQTDSISKNEFNTEFYDSSMVASNKATGLSMFIGHGFLKGDMSYYFSNPLLIGLNVDIYRRNLILQFDDFIGFGVVRNTMTFPDNDEWKKNEAALFLMLGGNLGYAIINTRSFKLAPIGGIGINVLTSSIYPTYFDATYQPLLPYYKLGFFVDIKAFDLSKEHAGMIGKHENYTSIRLSFGINSPIGQPEYSTYFESAMIYFTVGIIGFSRKYEKKQNNAHNN